MRTREVQIKVSTIYKSLRELKAARSSRLQTETDAKAFVERLV